MVPYITALDSYVEQALLAARDPSLLPFFFWISELGNDTTVFVLAAAAFLALAYRKKWPIAFGLCVSVFGSAAALFVLKELAARPRPAGQLLAYAESSFSFPSAHAALTIAFWGFCLSVLWSALPPAKRKAAALVVSVLALAVGFSRLYLGVHYLSDVIAGYALGAAFVYAGIIAARYLQKIISSESSSGAPSARSARIPPA